MRANRKQVVFVALVALAACGLLYLGLGTTERPIEGAAGQTPEVRLSVGSTTLPAGGQPFDVEVLVSGVESLGGFEFALHYDPALVQLVSVSTGEFLGDLQQCDANAGRCAVSLGPVEGFGRLSAGAYSYGDGPAASGDGHLATIRLAPSGATGVLSLRLSDLLFTGPDGSGMISPAEQALNIHIVGQSRAFLPLLVRPDGADPLMGRETVGVAKVMGRDALSEQDRVGMLFPQRLPLDTPYLMSRLAGDVAGMVPDVNLDAVTDVIDLQIAAGCWGMSPATVGCSSALDLDGSNLIDESDLNLIAARWHSDLTTLINSSPAGGAKDVAVTRETILDFSAPIDAGTIVSDTFSAHFGGQPLEAREHASPDSQKVTLFYHDPLPASARVRVAVNGDQLVDAEGYATDPDGDGLPGGQAIIDFDTLSLTVVPGTVVCGRVYASELGDDGNGGTVDVPLEGATITVDGRERELFALTDTGGDFCLDPAPAGRFFVHVDGRTASNGVPLGAYYPFVGKPWTSVPGQTVDVGVVHLPLVTPGTLQPVSPISDTVIHFSDQVLADHPEFAEVRINVPADSLYADDGARGGLVGIAPVPPDRLPGQLPDYLNFPVVITVQTDGATNFDSPAGVCFPNLPDPESGQALPQGAKSALMSFNHDTGGWSVVGSMTVSGDGLLVCTDEGVGILAPGWHGTQPGVSGAGGGGGGGDGERGSSGPNGCGPAGMPDAVPESPPGIDDVFTPACNIHDNCYSTCGKTQAQCDDQFLDDLRNICTGSDTLILCLDWANTYYRAVHLFGGGPYEDAQAESECSADRPQVVAEEATRPFSGPLYYGIYDVALNKMIRRGEAGSQGTLFPDPIILAPNNAYRLWILEASSLDVGFASFTTPAAGQRFVFPDVFVGPPRSWDLDFEGLFDTGEAIIGTDLYRPDTDDDGIHDSAEVQQGTNPVDGLAVQTGIIASVDTPGNAVDVCALDDVVVLALEDAGVAIVAAEQGANPVVVGLVDTPGSASGVACAPGRVVVADQAGGLLLLDSSDPPGAKIVTQLPLEGNVTAVAAAGDIAYAATDAVDYYGQTTLYRIDLNSGSVFDRLKLKPPIHDLALGQDVLYVLGKQELTTLSTYGLLKVANTVAVPGAVLANHINRLFVAEDILYTVHSDGYSTFDIADPADPGLISVGDTTLLGWKNIVTNESGLGIAAAGPNTGGGSSLDHAHLYDVSDPTETNAFITQYDTPGSARDVTLNNGLAYVADGQAGLHVLLYQSFDTGGVPPLISLATNGQSDEGKELIINATTSDDEQLRNVAFYVDGEVSVLDGNYPFSHRQRLPFLDRQSEVVLQALATDTGGNQSWSEAVTVTLTVDSTPPVVVGQAPGPGGSIPVGSLAAVAISFDEPLDSATLIPNAFTLEAASPSGNTPANGEPVPGTISYLDDINTAIFTPAAPLPVGVYTATLASAVTNLVGLPLPADVVWSFTVRPPADVFWIDPAGGNWSDPTNWDTGFVPTEIDRAFIVLDGNYSVMMDQNWTVASLTLGASSGNQNLRTDFRTLTIIGDSLIGANGTLTLYQTVLTGGGSMRNEGLLYVRRSEVHLDVINAGTVELRDQPTLISGTFANEAAGIVKAISTLTGSASTGKVDATFSQGWINDGLFELRSARSCCTDFQAIVRLPGGTLVNSATGTIRATPSGAWSALRAEVDNQGLVETQSDLYLGRGGAQHVNSGTIHAAGDHLYLDQGDSLTHSGIMRLDAGRRIDISNVDIDWLGVVSGTGEINLTGSTVNLQTDLPLATPLILFDVLISGTGTLTNTNYLYVRRSELNVDVTNAGHLELRDQPTALNGAFSNTATGTILAISTLTGSASTGRVDASFAQGWVNEGFLEINSPHSCCTPFEATVRVLNGTLLNKGSILGTNDSRARSTLAGNVVNEGIVAAEAWLQITGGPFENASVGLVKGAGKLEINGISVTNAGTVAPGNSPGDLDVVGSLPMEAAASLDIEIGGLGAGSQHDQLSLTGSASLTGTLNISLTNGYVPNVGDSFTIMTFSSRSGVFAMVNGADIGNGTRFDVIYNPTSVVLTVVP